MKFSSQIKPISYLKAHAAEIVRTLGDRRKPLIITQNGEAKAVMQDIDSYEEMQETVALLKTLALGKRQIEAGRVQSASERRFESGTKHANASWCPADGRRLSESQPLNEGLARL